MPTSILISQLSELTYITEDDIMMVVDSSSITTFRASVKTVKDYFASSGSVLSSSWASQSLSDSYAVNTNTASYMYPRTYNTTASRAISSSNADTASLAYYAWTASRLEGIGESYEQNMVINSDVSITSSGNISLRNRNSLTSSVNTTSIKSNALFFSKDYTAVTQPAGITGYGKLFSYSTDSQDEKIVFDVGHDFVPLLNGPNINLLSTSSRGILFQSDEAGNPNSQNRIGELFLLSGGVTYGRTFEGYIFSSSIALIGPVSFYGTASAANTCSFAANSPFPLPMGAVVAFAGTPTGSKWDGWMLSTGSTYNPITYPDFAAQVTNSYGHQATVTESIFNSIRRVRIGVITGSSGVLRLFWNGVTTYYLNLTSSNRYGVTISSLVSLHNYPYTITDYGWYPNVVVSRTIAMSHSYDPNTVVTYTLGTEDYRVPGMDNYFSTLTDLNPLNWAIRLIV